MTTVKETRNDVHNNTYSIQTYRIITTTTTQSTVNLNSRFNSRSHIILICGARWLLALVPETVLSVDDN